jgi:glutamyl endopeptidase
MNRTSKRLLFGAVALSLVSLASIDAAPSASGQDPAPSITMIDTSGPVTPSNGFSGHDPTGSETAPAPTTNDGEGGQPTGAESVIGPDGRVRVTNTTSGINRRIGQIEFFQADGLNPGDFICTGWLIDNNSILTSGHCVYDPPIAAGGTGGGIIESASWFPARNGGTDPFGECPVTQIAAPLVQWQQNGQAYWDYAIMNFANPGPCQSIGSALGTFGLFATANVNGLNGLRATVQGYPGDKPFGTEWKMNGRIAKANRQMTFYPMDTFGGQSGSPVWWNRTSGACTGPCGYAIHSYGVGLAGAGRNNNAGPRITAWRIGQIRDWAAQNGV